MILSPIVLMGVPKVSLLLLHINKRYLWHRRSKLLKNIDLLVLKSEKLPDVKKIHELKNPAVSVDLIEDRVEVANKELIVNCVPTLRT